MASARELWVFFVKQVQACAFPLSLFALFGLTMWMDAGRYELLLLACLGIQVWMLRSGWESKDELAVICVFHAAGLLLELYKVYHGSWFYPSPSVTKIGEVPVFSGFMYASVASYIIQAWRRFDLRMERWPHALLSLLVVAAIYVNFFTNHYLADFRWWALAAVVLVFARTSVEFTTLPGVRRRMPMLLAFFLIGFFVYLGENVCSLTGVYVYPHQVAEWKPVTAGKLSSWSLLVILSVLLVYWLRQMKAARDSAVGVSVEAE